MDSQHCVNCGFYIMDDMRVPLSVLSPYQIRIFNHWLPHAEFVHNDSICQACYKLVIRFRKGAPGLPVRVYGHRFVCVGCGASTARRTTHIIGENSPEMDVVRTWPSRPKNIISTKSCHSCWSKARLALALKHFAQDDATVRADVSTPSLPAAQLIHTDPPVPLIESDETCNDTNGAIKRPTKRTKDNEHTQADGAKSSAEESQSIQQNRTKPKLLDSEKAKSNAKRDSTSTGFKLSPSGVRTRFGECYCCRCRGRLKDTLYSTCDINGRPWSYMAIIRVMFRLTPTEINNIIMDRAVQALLICLDCQLILKEGFELFNHLLNNLGDYHKRRSELGRKKRKKSKVTQKLRGRLENKINFSLQQSTGSQIRKTEIKVDDRAINNEPSERRCEIFHHVGLLKHDKEDSKMLECTTITNSDQGFATEATFEMSNEDNDLLEEGFETNDEGNNVLEEGFKTIKEEDGILEEVYKTNKDESCVLQDKFETINDEPGFISEDAFEIIKEENVLQEKFEIVNVEENGVKKEISETTKGENGQFAKSFKTITEENCVPGELPEIVKEENSIVEEANGVEVDYDKNFANLLECDGGLPVVRIKNPEFDSKTKITENRTIDSNILEIQSEQPTVVIKLESDIEKEPSNKNLGDKNITITSDRITSDDGTNHYLDIIFPLDQKGSRELRLPDIGHITMQSELADSSSRMPPSKKDVNAFTKPKCDVDNRHIPLIIRKQQELMKQINQVNEVPRKRRKKGGTST